MNVLQISDQARDRQ